MFGIKVASQYYAYYMLGYWLLYSLYSFKFFYYNEEKI